jgi:hypothetical protein
MRKKERIGTVISLLEFCDSHFRENAAFYEIKDLDNLQELTFERIPPEILRSMFWYR